VFGRFAFGEDSGLIPPPECTRIAAAAPGIHQRAVKAAAVQSVAQTYDIARGGGTIAGAIAGNR
jgi:hypothetical protein